MNPYRIGDKVEVINSGQTYSCHDTAFRQFGFKDTCRNPCFTDGTIATVFNTGIVNGNDDTVSIRDEYGNESLISIKGVEIINQQTMPTKEQILEAAATSPEAKQALEKLFPEYFGIYVPKIKSICFPDGSRCIENSIDNKDRFWLNGEYNWSIEKDPAGGLYLIPTKK